MLKGFVALYLIGDIAVVVLAGLVPEKLLINTDRDAKWDVCDAFQASGDVIKGHVDKLNCIQ